ncbi:hypothetical protein BDY17DRAFT_152744 [Neohortaea acidophila]|uniref:Heterokaryon incompatibility domain-containing protein n=1 Tax=Neohortaea acidophila TaxID=245834 RepID=A0A6A6PUP5_9PEZI|nr:uncharacterized protein BDY17DRAFT_152744 [Neohortaea acidophila]KAF2483702.1 hypothetical protein BDY17DRAFT_152744 [Neohortaea acidophila]
MAEREWISVDSKGARSKTTLSSHMTIHTPPKTDIWRPSPTQDDFNAPFIYASLKSSAFRRISVNISAHWKTKYDQGGLIICWPRSPRNQSQWVKTGIEYFEGKPALSVVGCDRFSDWSLCPMPEANAVDATIEAVRVEQTLWVYLVLGAERRPLREIKWAFLEGRDVEAEMWVGIYAAKPTPESQDDLQSGIEVLFKNLTLDAE